jgi:hypothetical protein
MKQKATHAPVVVAWIDYGAVPDVDPPVEIWTGTGTTTIIMSVFGTGKAGVVFGASEAMDGADTGNSFPVSAEWVKTTIGPASRFVSVISCDGNAGTLYYYFPGQTNPDS